MIRWLLRKVYPWLVRHGLVDPDFDVGDDADAPRFKIDGIVDE